MIVSAMCLTLYRQVRPSVQGVRQDPTFAGRLLNNCMIGQVRFQSYFVSFHRLLRLPIVLLSLPQLLDVTDIIEASPRQCVICGVLAEWECAQCFGDHDSGLQSTAFCHACLTRCLPSPPSYHTPPLSRTHQHARRVKHQTERLRTPPGWVKRPAQPIPR